jgi:hypothetical protein
VAGSDNGGSKRRVMHVVEFLDEAYRKEARDESSSEAREVHLAHELAG